MNKLLTPLSLLLITLFFVVTSVSAQNFNWVKGGGSTQNLSSYTSESVALMCTDPNGNVYALSIIGNSGPIVADTFHRPTGAFGSNTNVLFTSHNCNGQMRFAKLITAITATPLGLTTDDLGHVYVALDIPHNAAGSTVLRIGYDTTITAFNNNRQAVIQYDTTGDLKWIQFVGSNAFSSYAGALIYGSFLAMDGFNNVHFINSMSPGVVITPSLTSHWGTYDLTYNTAGTLLSADKLKFDSSLLITSGTIDKQSNKLYVFGNRSQLFPDSSDYKYIAAFDNSSRNLIWKDTLSNPYFTLGKGFSSVAADGIGHLYTTAGAARGFVYRDDTVINDIATGSAGVTAIIKMDTAGNGIWIRKYSSSISSGMASLTLMPNNKIAACGSIAGTIVGGNDTISIYTGEGQNALFTIVDSAGFVQTLQQFHGGGFNDYAYKVASDKVGNLYIGGKVETNIWGGSLTPYTSIGGDSDYFISKYGVDCNCTSMPVANYTDTGSHLVKGFTYTGTSTSAIDSIRWEFGDGTTSTATNPLHTYAMAGTYTVCVTVYTACGSDMRCHKYTVAGPVSVVTTHASTSFADVKIYPNPSRDELNILNVPAPASYRLLTVTGANMLTGSLEIGSNSVSIQELRTGVYILEMVGDGVKNVVRIVKE